MSAYKVDENSEAVYRGIFDQMNKLHKEGNEESASKAEGIALELITHAELPLLFRAHAHMVLGSGNGNYLFHAQEAVRVVKKGIDLFGPDQGTSKLLKDAEEVLRYAKHDHKQLQEQMKAREAEGWEYVDPEDVEEGEEIDVLRYGGDVSKFTFPSLAHYFSLTVASHFLHCAFTFPSLFPFLICTEIAVIRMVLENSIECTVCCKN